MRNTESPRRIRRRAPDLMSTRQLTEADTLGRMHAAARAHESGTGSRRKYYDHHAAALDRLDDRLGPRRASHNVAGGDPAWDSTLIELLAHCRRKRRSSAALEMNTGFTRPFSVLTSPPNRRRRGIDGRAWPLTWRRDALLMRCPWKMKAGGPLEPLLGGAFKPTRDLTGGCRARLPSPADTNRAAAWT